MVESRHFKDDNDPFVWELLNSFYIYVVKKKQLQQNLVFTLLLLFYTEPNEVGSTPRRCVSFRSHAADQEAEEA